MNWLYLAGFLVAIQLYIVSVGTTMKGTDVAALMVSRLRSGWITPLGLFLISQGRSESTQHPPKKTVKKNDKYRKWNYKTKKLKKWKFYETHIILKIQKWNVYRYIEKKIHGLIFFRQLDGWSLLEGLVVWKSTKKMMPGWRNGGKRRGVFFPEVKKKNGQNVVLFLQLNRKITK